MNNYIIPANSKKSQLIFGLFKEIDLIILLIGACITLILMFVLQGDTIGMMVIKLLPVGTSLLLVFPWPQYHNVRVLLQEIYLFYSGRRTYRWRGWCATYDGYDEERKN